MRTELKWAEVSAVKAEVEQQVAALLGPKTEEDAAAAAAPKKKVRLLQTHPVLSSAWSCSLCHRIRCGYNGLAPAIDMGKPSL